MKALGYRELPNPVTFRRWLAQRVDSYTYFARGRWTGRIKIGRSIDPWRRVHELISVRNGEQAQLCVVLPCEALEASYHRAFAASGHGNEWFLPTDDILAEIAAHGGNIFEGLNGLPTPLPVMEDD